MEEITIRSIQEFLDTHLSRVVAKKGVLLLGPQFGRTSTNQTVGDVIREKLAEQNWLDKMDDDFDNLFMLKTPNVFLEYDLKSQLAKHYREMQPGPLFSTIARLPFRAIVSCTPDLMLKKTFDKLKLPYDFHYYAYGGQEQPKAREGVPILYSLFGTAENEESLIVTYEEFYKFFVKLMGGDQQMPEALKYVLQEAEFFMLLGFNLEKWYIPLIVRKLNEQKHLQDKARFSVLTRDSTFRPETRHKLSTTFIVLKEDTEPMLDAMEKAVSDYTLPPDENPPVPKPDPAQQKSVLTSVEDLIRVDELPKSIQLLLANAALLKIPGQTSNLLKSWDSEIAAAKNAFASSQISFPELSGILSKIRSALLDLIDRLRRDLGLDSNDIQPL